MLRIVHRAKNQTWLATYSWQSVVRRGTCCLLLNIHPATSQNCTRIVMKQRFHNPPVLTISSPTLADAIEEKLRNPSSSQNQETGFVAEYQGSPLHLMRVQSFSWEYSFNVPEDLQGPFRVELWSTRDGGTLLGANRSRRRHQRVPSMWNSKGKGLFGCRLEIVRDIPGPPISPRAGESPSTWIGIDTTPPQVTSLDVTTVDGNDSDAFDIQYAFEDPLAIPDSVRLSYSPHQDWVLGPL